MYRILTASSDTYITNKIIGSSFRATDANVGKAGTLDLFKLYDESSISGSTAPIELSRLLLKFDLNPLREMTGSSLNLNSTSFKCFLHLSDIYGGQTTPTNYKIVVMPLSKSFDEGFGLDIGQYQDLDSANFITSSISSGIVSSWNAQGANALGLLGSTNIDVISSGVINSVMTSFAAEQNFINGDEDLYVDVTRIISSTLVNNIPDCGMRVSFTGSNETDTRTLFVKRFASRHSSNGRKHPRLKVTYDDTIFDDHRNFYFDLTGSLFFNNTHRGDYANILSGSSLIPLTGTNCILLTLKSGSYTGYFTGSQHTIGSNASIGIYSATFAIPSNETTLKTEILNAASATFTEIWSSLDGHVPFLTSSIIIKGIDRTAFDIDNKRWKINIINMSETYSLSSKPKFRIFMQRNSVEDDFKYTKLPAELKSDIHRNVFYSIRDFHSNEVIIPFDSVTNSTRISTDKSGMYFDLYMDSFEPGRVYEIDIKVIDKGTSDIYKSVGGKFKVEK